MGLSVVLYDRSSWSSIVVAHLAVVGVVADLLAVRLLDYRALRGRHSRTDWQRDWRLMHGLGKPAVYTPRSLSVGWSSWAFWAYSMA